MRHRSPLPSSVALWAIASVLFLSFEVMAQQPKVLAPHKPVPVRLPDTKTWDKPAVLHTVTGGLWMTDVNFKSFLHVTNNLATDPLTVTPVLYLSNGHRLTLPEVKLSPSGTAVLSINDALQQQGIAPWSSLFGYVEVQYEWPWDAICATVRNTDVVHSLVFAFNLRPSLPAEAQDQKSMDSPSGANIAEGMWWKQESGVIGFVALSNTEAHSVTATVEASDNEGKVFAKHTVKISSHGTKMVHIQEMQGVEGLEGAIRVTYGGARDGLVINGGLEDPATGYSAHLPLDVGFRPRQELSRLSFAALGLMVGAADPMMRFPAGTTFTPYSVLRNISDKPIAVTPAVYWMEGATARVAQLQKLILTPSKTLRLDVSSLLATTALKNFNGSVNLVLDVEAKPGNVLMASGSVDQKNTYVFEVIPQATLESIGKSLSYWSTANGDDTMVTLWNPADEAQDFVFTLLFAGGHYGFPVHLGPRATHMFTLSELIQNQIPDAEGNMIPPSVHEGSAEISGARGEAEAILVAMEAGTYNVQKATCNNYCTTCQGAVSSSVLANPWAVPVARTNQLQFIVVDNHGHGYDYAGSSDWSSTNTSVATVNAGLVSGVSAGTANMDAFVDVADYTQRECLVNEPPVCPVNTGQGGSGGGTVQMPTSLSVVNVTVLPDGPDPPDGCPGSANYGIMIDIKYQVLDQHGSAIQSAAMTPHEKGISFAGSGYDSNIGPQSGYPTSSATTAADGTFHDVPFGVCATGPISAPGRTRTQYITIIMPDGSAPGVRNQTFNVLAPGSQSFGHGSISNSIGDISAQR